MLQRSENIMDSFNETIDKLSNEKLQQGKTNLSYEDDTEPHIVRHIAQTPLIHAFED